MSWFVYYNDDYDSQGLASFDTEAQAISFIERKMAQVRQNASLPASIESYIVIEGQAKELEQVMVVTQVQIKGR